MAPERGAQPTRAGRPGPRPPQSYQRIPAAAAAAMAGDQGRKLHELPWLYLDNVGQEYGPVPGCTMHEWLTLGRFPVGSDLRVRLPEWEWHLPLHQLYSDLSLAFVLPPAWPDVYGESPPPQPGEAAASSGQPPAPDAQSSGGPVPSPLVGGAPPMGLLAAPAAPGPPAGGSAPAASVPRAAARPPSGGPPLAQSGPSTPSARFVLERLMQEEPRPLSDEPILPKPPPQPSYSRLQELFSQPQEGPPTWEQ